MLLLFIDADARRTCNELKNTFVYLAVCTNSLISGSSLGTRMPLFILAGSRAQFDKPTKATFL